LLERCFFCDTVPRPKRLSLLKACVSADGIDTVLNHLIKTASHSTGSHLIWDIGEYSILPYREPIESQESSSEGSDGLERPKLSHTVSKSQKLHKAFQQSKIRLGLHGARLQQNYTISLRLSKESYCNEQPGWPKRRRRKLDPKLIQAETIETSSSEGEYNASSPSSAPFEMLKKVVLESCRRTASPSLKDNKKTASNPSIPDEPQAGKKQSGKSDIPEDQLPHQPNQANIAKPPNFNPIQSSTENETIRLTNAYPGALNIISSIHQRS
jgi:hypothetical protein